MWSDLFAENTRCAAFPVCCMLCQDSSRTEMSFAKSKSHRRVSPVHAMPAVPFSVVFLITQSIVIANSPLSGD